MGEWLPHKHDARIAVLMQTPPGETVEQQRDRCAEYGRLVTERGRDLGHNAFAMAVRAALQRMAEGETTVFQKAKS